MVTETMQPIARRELLALLGAGAAAILPAGPAWAQARGATLVIGIDISDTVTLDPVSSRSTPHP